MHNGNAIMHITKTNKQNQPPRAVLRKTLGPRLKQNSLERSEAILVPRALLTRGQPSATRGSGQIHIKLASDWPQRNIWFIVNMNKNTQALHEALVSLWWRKLGEKTLLMLK